MQIFEPKKAGRPRVIDRHHRRVEVKFTDGELALLDAFREGHGKKLSLSAAVRALTLKALGQDVLTKMAISD